MKTCMTLIAIILGHALAFASPVYAEESPLWKNVEGWDVRVDNTLGYGCFLMTGYEGGTFLRIGFDPSKNYSGYILLGDKDWNSLEVDKDYPLSLKFDQETPWNATARGVRFGSGKVTFLHFIFDEGDLLKEFARKHQLEVRYKDRAIARLKLKGSAAATKAMVQCQVEMRDTGVANSSTDPFSKKDTEKDPFAN